MFLEMYRRGMTLNEMAEVSGLSRYAVHRRLKKERWESGEIVITEKALRIMVREGLTIREMADRQFCSTGTICNKLKKYGVKHNKRGNPLWAASK